MQVVKDHLKIPSKTSPGRMIPPDCLTCLLIGRAGLLRSFRREETGEFKLQGIHQTDASLA
jgi:hypothetical protein